MIRAAFLWILGSLSELCCAVKYHLFLYFSDVDFPHDMCCFSSDSWKSLARLARSLFRSLKASGEENGSLLIENPFPAFFPTLFIGRRIVRQPSTLFLSNSCFWCSFSTFFSELYEAYPRVLLPNRPYQELNIIQQSTINVLLENFPFNLKKSHVFTLNCF